jgi:polyketide synthase 12
VSEIIGHKGALDSDVAISDIGVDSLGLAELLGRLEDCYGAGCISIDQLMDRPTVRAIAGHLAGLKAAVPAVPTAVAPRPPRRPSAAAKAEGARPRMASRAVGGLAVPSTDVGPPGFARRTSVPCRAPPTAMSSSPISSSSSWLQGSPW